MNFSMLKQAQELKSKLDKAQKELANTIVEADSGHGAVKVTMNCQQKVISVKIDPKAWDPNKPEKLEDLVVKAINDAIGKSQKVAAKELRGLTGGLKIPGLT
jgi:nucleoid-associated protein EbfC